MSHLRNPRSDCSAEVARGRVLFMPRGALLVPEVPPPSPKAPATTVLKSTGRLLPYDVLGSIVFYVVHADATLGTPVDDAMGVRLYVFDVVLLAIKALLLL